MMAKFNVLWYFANIVLLCGAVGVMAQEEGTCYGSGSIATSVILTLLIAGILAVLLYYLWKRYWEARKGKHLILETDPEKGKGEYAFDNPGFKDAGMTPIPKSLEKNVKLEKLESGSNGNRNSNSNSNKLKWNQWSPLGVLTLKNEKKRTQDDSSLDDQIKAVSLRSHDFTGLGFNICGNMREGIYIKDILHRGPASESGKLNSGDRISSVNISFEHMVYEDALTILSYASPYDVTIFARSGKAINHSGHSGQPGHPIYRSSSSTDLLQIGKSAKKCLFQADESSDMGSNYSSLQKTRSTATTLERSASKSPKPNMKIIKTTKLKLSPDQLKTQLEQKIIDDHKENLKLKNNDLEKPLKIEAETQKTDNKYQKFGIKVLPLEQKEQKSPKTAELSQNDNNINLERHQVITEKVRPVISIDEVDKKVAPPPVKKREKINKPMEKSIEKVKKPLEKQEKVLETEAKPSFERKTSLNGSGIKRDINNIPLEMPNNMYNAALAARKNRKAQEEEDAKSPKKKGKAPPPPAEERSKFDEIMTSSDVATKSFSIENNPSNETTINISLKDDTKDYNSDSDIEIDNQSSVNTIELNASDITVHQSEENEEKQNRKTASTGDLTKIHKTRKTSTGTLERAQSLDITDTSMPSLTKKRKAGKIEDNFESKTSSDGSMYGNVLMNKEPRLSLILDGLNTFQRSRLKKSTEWGNLEDAILSPEKRDGSSESFDRKSSSYEDFKVPEDNLTKNFNFGAKSPEFHALVNKINEIKQETIKINKVQDMKIQHNLEEAEKEIITRKNNMKLRSEEVLNTMEETPQTFEVMRKTMDELHQTRTHELPNMNETTTKSITTMQTMEETPHHNISKPIRMDDNIKATILSTEVKKIKNQIWPFEGQKDEINEIQRRKENGIKDSEKFHIRINKESELSEIESPNFVIKENTLQPLTTLIFEEKSPELRQAFDDVYIKPTEVRQTFEDVYIKPTEVNKFEEKKNPLENFNRKVEITKKPIEILHTIETVKKPLEEILTTETKIEVFSDPIFEEINTPEMKIQVKPIDINVTRDFEIASIETKAIFPKIDLKKSEYKTEKIDNEIVGNTNINVENRRVNVETIEVKEDQLPIVTQKIVKTEPAPINIGVVSDFILAERAASDKYVHEVPLKLDDMNISDDIKVSRHSLGSLERPKYEMKLENTVLDKQNISNITITNETEEMIIPRFEMCTIKTDSKPKIDNFKFRHEEMKNFENVIVSTPDLIKNITIAEAIHDLNNEVTIDGPSSLTFEIPRKKIDVTESSTKREPVSVNRENGFQLKTNGDVNYFDGGSAPVKNSDAEKNNSSLTYITEIQVSTPNNKNVSEIEIVPNVDKNLDKDFDNYIKNFESNIKNFENNIHTFEQTIQDVAETTKKDVTENTKSIAINEVVEVEREFQKVQDIAEEQLKKLPEMRFTTSSYESQLRTPEKRQSQIEILRSNFEKSTSPPRGNSKTDISPPKSRIPVALSKTPPTSPERRDSRTLDIETNKDIIEMMSSHIPMTSSIKYQPKATTRNVTVTSIRSNSKIPSGLPTYANRPPVPTRKLDGHDDVQISSNGNGDSTFKQWVFNPTDSSVTNITVTDTKIEHK